MRADELAAARKALRDIRFVLPMVEEGRSADAWVGHGILERLLDRLAAHPADSEGPDGAIPFDPTEDAESRSERRTAIRLGLPGFYVGNSRRGEFSHDLCSEHGWVGENVSIAGHLRDVHGIEYDDYRRRIDAVADSEGAGLDYGESRETLTTSEMQERELDWTPLIVGRLALGEPWGSCMRASLATITGLDIPVPDDSGEWWEHYQTFLRGHGWALDQSPSTRPVLGYSVAIGPSPDGIGDHAMVALDGVVIWDPGSGRADGEGFKPRSFCPVYRLASATAHPADSEGAGLDVERLALAVQAVFAEWDDAGVAATRSWQSEARAIAREYDALSVKETR